MRSQTKPITAEKLGEILEVSTRTVYRDIAALQAMRTPIEGEAGIGYVMRSGYDLPPLNFEVEEIEAIVVGLSLLRRTGDSGLLKAAARVSAKIDKISNSTESLHVSSWGADAPLKADMSMLRQVIRDEQKILIHYCDKFNSSTRRTVLPISIVYYVEVIVLVAWCELRNDFRCFRADRISVCKPLDKYFKSCGHQLRIHWQLKVE